MSDHTASIESVLDQFGIDGKVTGMVRGPSVTRYEITLGPGVKVEKVARLQKNFAYQCAAESVRVLAPIPGKTAVGVELPNRTRGTVSMGDIVAGGHPLSIGVGKDVEGNVVSANLAKMPHLLVAGTTGSGKSSFVNSMLVSLLERDPEKVRLVLIDPKQVELTPYNGVVHLMWPVVTETGQAVMSLQALVNEMEQRYAAMQAAKVRHVDELGCPYIVVVIDELADLVMQDRANVEPPLIRLLQKGRAAGVHVVLATQRPSVDVISGLIKTNVPSRLAFSTASAVDSRVVLDESGAEQLLGAGDALYKPIGARTATRLQGALVTDEEIAKAVKTATATAEVEDMVEQLHSEVPVPTGLDALNWIIAEVERAGERGAEFMETFLSATKKGHAAHYMVLAPAELGHTTDVLIWLAKCLRKVREDALAGVP